MWKIWKPKSEEGSNIFRDSPKTNFSQLVGGNTVFNDKESFSHDTLLRWGLNKGDSLPPENEWCVVNIESPTDIFMFFFARLQVTGGFAETF